ncbi:traB domain-containing protein-like isoform X2 [Colias croceus]|nr:traB domain-containing protein-like isoform X2 [Colias croceus]XP_045493625.1 traB domain-containing protein-like isoform X2 [Colias croceus]XP_045493626.1 traB domain-containing protein-like isoform X2 [Colias croceus]XP_045493627.1 traB domain-containing protein-like isoform X2 [Colias croceus]
MNKMEADGEKEHLLINQASKAAGVKCDIVNECQMFLKAEEGGGDAHKIMGDNIVAETEKSKNNFINPPQPESKEISSEEALHSNPDNENEGNGRQSLNDSAKAQGAESPDLRQDGLPNTVTVLDAPNGGKVYLVGTAHFSLQSQEDVSRVIQEVSPHIVMVELCEQRTNILLLDEEVILREAKNINIKKIRATMAQNGVFNGLMYILLLNMSANITRELGMAPGGEFRRAMAEAKKVPNCIVQLGDRAIDITLHRAIASLSWGQTIRFIWHLLTSNQSISLEEVERCKQKKMLEDMLEEMAGEFPALKRVFVVERDMYLCHSLQVAALQTRREPCRIVGVVGIGHVAGIVDYWGKITPQDITPLLVVPPPSLSTRIIRLSVRAACAGALLYAGYKLVPRRWLP